MLAVGTEITASAELGTKPPISVISSQYSVRSVDGVSLSLRAWGAGEPRYFLIHGFGDCGASWNRCARSLSRSGATVAIDLRGHGDSGRDPTRQYAPKRYIEDVAGVLRAQDMKDVVLIGHSMGAAIAIHVATRCVDRVRALVLVDGGPYLRRAVLQRVREEFLNQPWQYDSVEEYSQRLESKMRHVGSSVLREVAQGALARNSCGGWMLKCDPALANGPAYIDDEALSSVLARVTCPVMVIRGAFSSVLTRTAAKRLLTEIPNGTFGAVPESGHAVMLDNPEGLATCVTELLAATRKPRPRCEAELTECCEY
jgi:pimeloyl-ACP methyl ester carboxylesterase